MSFVYMSESSSNASPAPKGTNRERILRAALDIISGRGVDKVTHRAVASLAGVSPGTTTYHFATREDLVREAFILYMEDYQKSLVAVLTRKPISCREDLIQFMTNMTTLIAEPAELAAIEYEMLLFSSRDTALKMLVSAWSRTLESWLSDPLERLGAERPLEAARMLMAISRGSEFEVMARHQPITHEQFERRLEIILKAVLS